MPLYHFGKIKVISMVKNILLDTNNLHIKQKD